MNKKTYNKNLLLLKKYYPELHKKLINIKKPLKYELKSINGSFNIFVRDENRFYYDDKNPLHSALEDMKKQEISYARLVFLLGFGLGYEYQAFLKLYKDKLDIKKLIIVEKEIEVFYFALHLNDMGKLIENKNVYFFVGLDSRELIDDFGVIAWKDFTILLYIKALGVISTKSGFSIDSKYYLEAFRNMKKVVLHKITIAGNDIEDSMWGISNMLENLDEIIRNPGIKNLYDKFKGKPAVVVASGPSLDKNIKYLKGMEDNVLIICADSALKILRSHGITPHITVMIERPKFMATLFESLSREDMINTYLVAAGVIHRDVYKIYEGEKIILFPPHKPFLWLDVDKGYTNIRLSAGNMTFQVAELLKADPIIVIGQDLSFANDERTHAKGMPLGQNVKTEKQRKKMKVKGNYQEEVLTHEIWFRFLECYEEDVRKYTKEGATVINCTDGGAHIDGTILGNLDEELSKYAVKKIYPSAIIRKALCQEGNIDEQEVGCRVADKIEKTIEDLEYYIHRCKYAQAIFDKYGKTMEAYLHEKQGEITDEIMVEFEKIGNEIMSVKAAPKEKIYTYQNFFIHIFQSYLINFEIQAQDAPNAFPDRREAYIYQILMNSKWFQTLKQISEMTIYLLKKGRNNIIVNLELDIEPSIITQTFEIDFEKK